MSNLKDAYIVDAIRTPVGKFCGTMSTVRSDDMAALVIKELVKRNDSIDPSAINDVVLGCANQAGEDNRDVARMALLLAGLPYTVPGETVNRLCSSGMASTINCSRAVRTGDGDLYISGGVESMTRAPFVMAKAPSAYSRKAEVFDTSIGWRFINPKLDAENGTDGMGRTAENLAEKYSISREDQDAFAAWSQ
ncbi:MAG: 3-oxoadipyl-CoA thiolase, partial [Bacteroidia bacterium]|nr:3-oxoadipyl-CoA thiolase [Bacteroidia bacterium]